MAQLIITHCSHVFMMFLEDKSQVLFQLNQKWHFEFSHQPENRRTNWTAVLDFTINVFNATTFAPLQLIKSLTQAIYLQSHVGIAISDLVFMKLGEQ